MKRLTDDQLAKRAQQLADVLHDLKKAKDSAKSSASAWKKKVQKLQDEADMLGEAVRLKTEVEEQLQLLEGEQNG